MSQSPIVSYSELIQEAELVLAAAITAASSGDHDSDQVLRILSEAVIDAAAILRRVTK
jgi:hypothetical protein